MTDDQKEFFEERSAIRQFEGLQKKQDAEKDAFLDLNLRRLKKSKEHAELLKLKVV